jgi:integrase
LRWSEIDWGAREISKPGKGGRRVKVKITPTIRDILWPLHGHHAEHVFTYKAQRARDGRVKGKRYPLTYSGVKIAWRRLRSRAGVTGFRFHDYRHDLATKLLRETGNLKLVQRALNHADLKTTTRYAHVMDDEVAEAMERVAESRKKSRSDMQTPTSHCGNTTMQLERRTLGDWRSRVQIPALRPIKSGISANF